MSRSTHASSREFDPLDQSRSPSPVDTNFRLMSEPYTKPHLGRSLSCLATSLLPFVALWALMYLTMSVSYVLTLLLAIPTAGFLVRTYILFHDCAHGSLLASRRANTYLGAVLGLVVCTPFPRWRHEHTVHHATAGDLDR